MPTSKTNARNAPDNPFRFRRRRAGVVHALKLPPLASRVLKRLAEESELPQHAVVTQALYAYARREAQRDRENAAAADAFREWLGEPDAVAPRA